MLFKILYDLLPDSPTVEKAVYRSPNGHILFGTLYTASQEDVRRGITNNVGPFRADHPAEYNWL